MSFRLHRSAENGLFKVGQKMFFFAEMSHSCSQPREDIHMYMTLYMYRYITGTCTYIVGYKLYNQFRVTNTSPLPKMVQPRYDTAKLQMVLVRRETKTAKYGFFLAPVF